MKHVHYNDAFEVIGITEHLEGSSDPLGDRFVEVEDDVEVALGMTVDPEAKKLTPNKERQDAIINGPRIEALCDKVDAERDRRVNTRFLFEGRWFQCRPQDVVNITGAGASALAAVVSGSPWPEDFQWITEDNSVVPMDAQKVIAMGNAYTAFRRAMIFKASEMKARVRAGEEVDYLSDSSWEG